MPPCSLERLKVRTLKNPTVSPETKLQLQSLINKHEGFVLLLEKRLLDKSSTVTDLQYAISLLKNDSTMGCLWGFSTYFTISALPIYQMKGD
jgi:hypothetical protein